jgi:O-antigen/teichoic acid export membrane protein
MIRSLVARVASLFPAAIATLLATRLILGHYDVAVFDGYTLVFSLMVLIPLNDLGAGAALTTAVAERGVRDPSTAQVALTAMRTLFVSGLGLAAVALGVSALGLWDDLLGSSTYATGTFGVAIALYGLSFVPGLGQSILLGFDRNELTVLVQGSLAPAMAAGAGACVLLDLSPRWVVLAPGLAVVLVTLLNAWVSAHETGLRLLPLVPLVPRRRAHPGARIRSIAGPALILAITSPLTLQMDRFVLSHVSTSQDVAKYSVTLQIFSPLIVLIPAAARPLWPRFTQDRITGQRSISLLRVIPIFVVLTSVSAAALVAASGPIAQVIGDDQIDLGVALPILMAVVCVVQSIAIPASMALMFPKGLRFLAALSLVALPINLALSIPVADHLGAPGPLAVGIGVGTLLQTVPALAYLAWYRRHPEAAASEHLADDGGPGDVEPDAFVVAPIGGPLGINEEGPMRFVDRWREDEHGRSW